MTFRPRRLLAPAVSAGLALLFALPVLAAPEAGSSAVAPDITTWLRDMDTYYQAHPDLRTTPGSGWKPYNRIKWFVEQRMMDGRLPAPDARWKAWERKRQVEATAPPARNTWFSLGPENFGGRMLCIDFDPTNVSTVYAGSASGGLWRSTDSGTSWTPLTDDLPVLSVSGVAVSKTNPNVVVIATGEGPYNSYTVDGMGIFRSTDSGATWNTTNLSFGVNSNHAFNFVECGPSGTLLAGATDGMYRSTDDGATWTLIPSGTPGGEWYDAIWSPTDPNTVYSVRGNAVPGASVKISTDDGATWTKAGTGQPASAFIGKAKLGIAGGGASIYCFIGNSGSGGSLYGLIRSDDGGATWTDLSATSTGLGTGDQQSWYNLFCAGDPDNAARVIVGAVQIYRSGNSGASFQTVTGSAHVDQHVIQYEPGSTTNVWAGNDGGMWFSNDDGRNGTWTGRNNGLVSYQFYDICVNNGPGAYYALGGTQDNGTDRWSGTTTWANAAGGDGMVCNISPLDGTTVYAESQFGFHYRSTNAGVFFSSVNSGITGSANWVAPVALRPGNPDHVLTATSAGIFRSLNGTSWSNVAGQPASWIDYSPVNDSYAWSINGSQAHVTTDNGSSWSAVTAIPFPVGNSTKILAHPTDLNTVFVTFSGYTANTHVARSTDLGVTWADVSGDFTGEPVNAIAVDPTNPTDWYIGTDTGVWHSGNGGVNWTPFETGLPNVLIFDLEIQDAQRKLVAGTHGRGMWEVDIPPAGAVDVAVGAPGALNLLLDRPWPNPAGDRTLLRYAAKSGSAVSLKIYDVNGRLVSDLEDFSRGDGIVRTTPWFIGDAPAGVYFAVLQAGEIRKSQKIIVVR